MTLGTFGFGQTLICEICAILAIVAATSPDCHFLVARRTRAATKWGSTYVILTW